MPNKMSASPLSRNTEKKRRLFFAFLPDTGTKEKLTVVQENLSGRKIPKENLHLTLFFLGNQPESVLPLLERFLDRLPFNSFGLSLDRVGYFPKIRLGWIGPAEIPSELVQLHSTTRQFLVPAYREDKTESFRPHITLIRQSHPSPLKIGNPIVWTVERLALMESILSSEPGKHPEYRVLHEKTARIQTTG